VRRVVIDLLRVDYVWGIKGYKREKVVFVRIRDFYVVWEEEGKEVCWC